MRTTKNLWWKTLTGSIFGFEGEGDGGQGAGAGDGGAGDGSQDGAGEGQGTEGTGNEGDGAVLNPEGLKSALEKERAERKKLEKDLKALQKSEQARADAEKSEIQRATDSEKATAAKVEKLAAGFRSNAVESAILRAAATAKFRDPSDALRPEIIAAVGVEQDEDDPSKVEIDEATVTEAIKKLAKDRPHYVGTTETKTPKPKSGSSFAGTGNGRQGTQDDPEKAALLTKFPALRGRV